MAKIIVFTDGASRGNPGPGGWAAILAFVTKGKYEIVELGGRKGNTTNNQMELTAVIKALEFISKSKNKNQEIIIHSDSSYLINGITKWIFSWLKNNWTTSLKENVLNKKMWQKILKLAKGRKIEWKYVGGHVGISANERADKIATSFADGIKIKLFEGDNLEYGIDLFNFRINDEKSNKKAAGRVRARTLAYSYVSLVDSKIKTHWTWADCEKRVKGVSGAKFKKTLNKQEEHQIIKEWSKL